MNSSKRRIHVWAILVLVINCNLINRDCVDASAVEGDAAAPKPAVRRLVRTRRGSFDESEISKAKFHRRNWVITYQDLVESYTAPTPTTSPTVTWSWPTQSPVTVTPRPMPMPTYAPTPTPILIPVPPPIQPSAPTPMPLGTLFQVLSDNPNLTILTEAIVVVGLDAALRSPSTGPLTVFAASNQAFLRTLDLNYLQMLAASQFDLQLTDLLMFQVAKGEYPSTSLIDGFQLIMLNGETIEIRRDQMGTVSLIDGMGFATTVVQLNELAVNGIVHPIDNVLLPLWVSLNPMTALEAQPNLFTMLQSLISSNGLGGSLSNLVQDTLLAPDDTAFRSLPQPTLNFFNNATNAETTRYVLLYHVITTMLPYTQLDAGLYTVPTLAGENITVAVTSGTTGGKQLTFNGVPVVGQGVYLTKENIIYEISAVLIPPSLQSVIPSHADNQVHLTFYQPPVNLLSSSSNLDPTSFDVLAESLQLP